MKKKIFFASNSVRTAKWVISSIIALGGSLAIFYASNDILPEQARFESNARLVKKAGVFESEEACLEAVDTPKYSAKRRFTEKAYHVAKLINLIGEKEPSEVQIVEFFKGLDDPANFTSQRNSFIEFDQHATLVEAMCEKILEKTEMLSNSDPKEFKVKKLWFRHLASICNSLDGQGTYVGNFNRAHLNSEMMKWLFDFQTNSAAPSSQKLDIVSSCLPFLQKPYDLRLMFRIEHFRIRSMIENLRGGKKHKVRSNIVEESKPMSPIERLQLLFPGVDSAWKSKLDSTFAKAIVKSQQLPKYGNGDDMRVLAQIRTSLEEDPANTRYLHHFGIDFTALFLKFNDTYVYTSKVTHPKRVPHPQIETKN